MIKWSLAAKKDINDIWDYFVKKNELDTADKIVNTVISSVVRLVPVLTKPVDRVELIHLIPPAKRRTLYVRR